MARRTTEAPANVRRVPWERFLPAFKSAWQQGEHVTGIGPTGAGKSTLLLQILEGRKYRIVLATKPRDPLIAALTRRGYVVMRELDKIETTPDGKPRHPHVVFWPKIENLSDEEGQRLELEKLFAYVYRVGGWALLVDELNYVAEHLRLDRSLKVLWQQGRTLEISLVAGAQRPAFVPRTAYSSATHLFIWRTNDPADIDSLSGLGSADTLTVRYVVERLAKYEVLYVNTRTGVLLVTKPKRIR